MTGLLAVGVAAYLAAVYLTRDAQRTGDAALAEAFRRRALVTGGVVGAMSMVGLLVLRSDAPALFAELTGGPALALVMTSVVAGVASLVLVLRRAYLAVRVTAALAVTALLWAWGVGQYPRILPRTDLASAAATDAVLAASLGALGVGALLLVPSLTWLYWIFQRPPVPQPSLPQP